jgi:hypothetical protein
MYNYIAVGERIICQEGGRSQPPPGPIKGNVLHNCVITGGQQACHTDDDKDT